MEHLQSEINNCDKCCLCDEGKPVPGEGNTSTSVVLVGEAPGATEARTGRPFVGQAGKLLDELLAVAGLRREDVFITNIVKCRPPKNRNPKPEEIAVCTPYLDRQLEYIKPRIICCLGNFSTRYIMEKYGFGPHVDGISRIHGRIFDTGTIMIMPLYHPAAALYNRSLRVELDEDFRRLGEIVGHFSR
jgi:uracil-DNA glycosylase family 4